MLIARETIRLTAAEHDALLPKSGETPPEASVCQDLKTILDHLQGSDVTRTPQQQPDLLDVLLGGYKSIPELLQAKSQVVDALRAATPPNVSPSGEGDDD